MENACWEQDSAFFPSRIKRDGKKSAGGEYASNVAREGVIASAKRYKGGSGRKGGKSYAASEGRK